MTATSISVIPGLSLPFFPMRPIEGRSLSTPDKAVELALEFTASGDLLQPKLNGDRACVAVVRSSMLAGMDLRQFKFKLRHFGPMTVLIQNRHGRGYGMPVNLEAFAKCMASTCVDGEVFKGHFYPFEVLTLGGVSMMREGPKERANMAKVLCRSIGVDWLFAPPSLRYLRLCAGNLPFWEGFVRKKAGSPYVPCANDSSVSSIWFKHKWY